MASWIGTRVFYAIVFFMFGAWVASMSPEMKGVMRQASEIGSQGFEKMRIWTSNSLTPRAGTPEERKGAAPEAVAPVAAPAVPDLLVNARAAYARGDILGAINAYRDYIDRNPGSIEARGELGNVYFTSGRLRDAARIFYEAAIMKLNGGDAEGAKTFLGPVRQGDGALADDLARRIATGAPDKK